MDITNLILNITITQQIKILHQLLATTPVNHPFLQHLQNSRDTNNSRHQHTNVKPPSIIADQRSCSIPTSTSRSGPRSTADTSAIVANIGVHTTAGTLPTLPSNTIHLLPQLTRMHSRIVSVENLTVHQLKHQLQWNLRLIAFRDVVSQINLKRLDTCSRAKR